MTHKSATERAEKIVVASRQDRYSTAVALKELIAAELEAYAGMRVRNSQHCCFAEDSPCNQRVFAIETIRSFALEEAAKVVKKNHAPLGTHDCISRDLDDPCRLAEDILALKGKK